MAEERLQNGDGDLQAPAALAEALRRLQGPMILVPPQVDEAALGRARLHLARIRQLSRGAGETGGADREDLALAARTRERGVRPSQFSSRSELGPMARFRKRGKKSNLLPWLIIVALLAGALLLFAWWNKHSPHRAPPAIPRQTIP